MKLYTYKVEIENIERDLLSVIDPDTVFSKGLIGNGVIGYLRNTDGEVNPDNIIYNPDFIELFKRTIKSTTLTSEDLLKSALQQQNGYIYIVDQRAKNEKETEQRDILGSIKVIEGQVSADSFQFNPNYEIISADGIFRLPDNFEKALLNEITK